MHTPRHTGGTARRSDTSDRRFDAFRACDGRKAWKVSPRSPRSTSGLALSFLGSEKAIEELPKGLGQAGRQAQVLDRVIQALMGHHSDEMTELYDRVEVRERRRAIGQVIRFAGLATKVGG